jgi:hypothetical protein
MNCFNHRDKPAIGLCKACAKALCEECVVELTNGLACKNSCEDRVNMINRMLDSNSQVMGAARHQTRSSGVMTLILGLSFLVFAIFAYFETGGFLPYFLGVLGVAFLITGIFRLSKKQQYPEE